MLSLRLDLTRSLLHLSHLLGERGPLFPQRFLSVTDLVQPLGDRFRRGLRAADETRERVPGEGAFDVRYEIYFSLVDDRLGAAVEIVKQVDFHC